MLHDGRHSDRFVYSTDHSLYRLYDITDLQFVSEFHDYFSFLFPA